MMGERKYVAVSIKHSDSKTPVLWGDKRTADDEGRRFSGYTIDIDSCELYSLEEFRERIGHGVIKCDEAVSMCFDYRKRYKKWDTVLVDAEEMSQFLRFL